MLMSAQSPHVAVNTGGLDAYGLDFSEMHGNHASFDGALKITDHLAEWMAAEMAEH
jgi:hypothetical protein